VVLGYSCSEELNGPSEHGSMVSGRTTSTPHLYTLHKAQVSFADPDTVEGECTQRGCMQARGGDFDRMRPRRDRPSVDSNLLAQRYTLLM
jgi:hypothetical protein